MKMLRQFMISSNSTKTEFNCEECQETFAGRFFKVISLLFQQVPHKFLK